MTGPLAPTGQTTTLPDPPAGRDRWAVHVYAHTHWDREWYQPFERFRMHLVSAIDRILDTLDADPSFTTYVLDGQTIVLDDYLALRPERAGQLGRLIESGRIEIGPWYILPDEFLVSGESLVRNLVQGRRDARRHCDPLGVGYLPDPFGHVAQMPQVLAGFGIGSIVFSRGMGNEFHELGSGFEWAAPDGESSVLAIVQTGTNTNGYCNAETLAHFLDPDEPRVYELSDDLARHLAERTNSDLLLFAAGCDHETINPQLPEIVARLNERFAGGAEVEISGLGPAVARAEGYLRERADGGTPPGRFEGELRGSLHAPILGGIFSARIPLKQDNALLQTWLERYTEPMTAIAGALGVWPTPRCHIDNAWKLTLQNQPHDSIGGCSVDAVHDEMPSRTMRALEVCQALHEELMTALGVEGEAMVFNPHGVAAGGIAERLDGTPVRVAQVPPLNVMPLDEAAETGGACVVDESTVQSDLVRVGIAGGGVRVVLRGRDGTSDVTIEDALSFVDLGDAGDEYDFGAVDGDREIVAELVDWYTQVAGPGVAELVVRHSIELPVSLNEDRDGRSVDVVEHELITALRVADGVPWVDCVTSWVNLSADHRLRLRCALGGSAPTSAAGGHFAVIERPTAAPAHQDGWKQQPLPSHHCEGFASIATNGDAPFGVAVLSRGLHEYEVTPTGDGGSALDVTIVRSVGWLSRKDIVGRPGHAGPAVETPGAQCIGEMEVEFAIAPFAGDWQSSGLATTARRYMAPPFVVEPIDRALPPHSGMNARKRDIVVDLGGKPAGARALRDHGLSLEGIELSTVKLAEDDSGDLVVRGYNPLRTACDATLTLPASCTRVQLARLDETPTEELGIDGGAVRVSVPGAGIRTFRLGFQ